jgi:Rrf2 family protein
MKWVKIVKTNDKIICIVASVYVYLRQKSLNSFIRIKMLSKKCVYGIRSILYLTLERDREFVPIKEISKKLDISFHFLTKILQTLSQGGIILSFKGPRGGVKLARPATEISILDIVHILDGKEIFEQCILGLPGCQELRPCPLHESWEIHRNKIRSDFDAADMFSLSQKIRAQDLRLYDLMNN